MIDALADLPTTQLYAGPQVPAASLQSRVRRLDNARYHGGARDISAIRLIGWHSTRGHDADEAMAYDNRPNSTNPASYTYLIAFDGTIYRVNPVTRIPYSNGDFRWPNPLRYPPGNGMSMNAHILAIAFAGDLDDATGAYEHLRPAQLESGWWLGKLYSRQFPDADHVGHLEGSPGRKDDPRPQFLHMSWWRAVLAGDACPTYTEYLDVHPLPGHTT